MVGKNIIFDHLTDGNVGYCWYIPHRHDATVGVGYFFSHTNPTADYAKSCREWLSDFCRSRAISLTQPLRGAFLPAGDDVLLRAGEQIYFIGDAAGYEHLGRLLSECKEAELFVSIEITGKVISKRLKEMINEGANEFIVVIENESALKILQELEFADVRAKWFMDGENFREIKQKVELAESLGVKELIITGMKPHDVKKSAPSREAL